VQGQPPSGVGGPSLSPGRWIRAILREFVQTVLPAVLMAAVIHLFLAQATRVYGQSMEPNLHTDQRLIVEKVSYRFHGPQRGDIVVLKQPGCDDCELLIKRVIGLAGEEITIHGGQVYVDSQPVEEPYLTQVTTGSFGPVRVPPLHVFVMGDNRGASNDSRIFGTVPRDEILGRAWISYWPPDQISVVE
jgi:signal peptidase I